MKLTEIPYRPLGLIANALEAIGLEVSYSYEDLVFVESTVVLLRMSDPNERILIYFNESCRQQDSEDLFIKLSLSGKEEGLHFEKSGKFKLTQSANKEMQVTFIT